MSSQHIHITFQNGLNESLFYQEAQAALGIAVDHHHIDLIEGNTVYVRVSFEEELGFAQQATLHSLATTHLGGSELPATTPGPYSYPNTDIDTVHLQDQIALEEAISKGVLYTNKDAQGISVHFEEDLYQSEINALTSIVNGHNPTAIPESEKTGIRVEDLAPSLLAYIAGESGGSFYRYREDNQVSTTTSTSWQNKIVMSLSDLQDAVYRIKWAYNWSIDDTQEDFEVSIELHDATTLIEELFFHKQEAKDKGGSFGSTGTDQRYSTSSFASRRMGDVRTIVIKWRSGKSGKKASIWGAKIEVEKVSEDFSSIMES